jgi:hypothetical protein
MPQKNSLFTLVREGPVKPLQSCPRIPRLGPQKKITLVILLYEFLWRRRGFEKLELLQLLVQIREVESESTPRYVWDAPRDRLNLWLEVHLVVAKYFLAVELAWPQR